MSNVGFVNPPIGETLARGTFDDIARTLGIREAEAGAAIVAELKFREVAVQVLLGTVLIDAEL